MKEVETREERGSLVENSWHSECSSNEESNTLSPSITTRESTESVNDDNHEEEKGHIY